MVFTGKLKEGESIIIEIFDFVVAERAKKINCCDKKLINIDLYSGTPSALEYSELCKISASAATGGIHSKVALRDLLACTN